MRRVSKMVREFLSNIGFGMPPLPSPAPAPNPDLKELRTAIEEQQRNIEARLYLLKLRAEVATGIAHDEDP
jgi:hypothetical protein